MMAEYRYLLISSEEQLWAVKGMLAGIQVTQVESIDITHNEGNSWTYATFEPLDPDERAYIKHNTGVDIKEMK